MHVNPRVIPVMLIDGTRLIKTIRFDKEVYLGDPINSIKLFNDMMVDEIIVLDIKASQQGRSPNLEFISRLASECFMPVCYGGGITNVSQAEKIFRLGIEKISVQSEVFERPHFIRQVANKFGSQSIVVSIDVKKDIFGNYHVYTNRGKTRVHEDVISLIHKFEKNGAGEVLINSIDRDGTFKGYDIPFIKQVSSQSHIPVIACGGATNLDNIRELFRKTEVSAAAGGSVFVFSEKKQGILIHYPDQKSLRLLYKTN